MPEEINQLKTDLKNTKHELGNINKMKRHLKWFVVLGALVSPLGMMWHIALCFVIFGLFLVLFLTSYYISYGHTKGLNRRLGAIMERLNELGANDTTF